MRRPKVIVVGLDGASSELVGRWSEEGHLPTFKRLMNSGASGTLKSTLPISTSPAWKCYSTGKNPGNFGMFYWFNFDVSSKSLILTDSRTCKAKEIWDYLTENGFRSAIIDMPTTYPPKNINGILISGFPSFDHLGYTFPASLKEDLVRKYDYLVNPRMALRRRAGLTPEEGAESREQALDEIERMIKSRFSIARDLLAQGDIDFLHLTIFLIDNVQHYLWGPMVYDDPRFGKTILRFWKLIDKELDDLIGLLDLKATSLFIMSDHGSTFLKGRFKFNAWLQSQGYLSERKKNFSFSSILFRLGLNREAAQEFSNTRLGRLFAKVVPYRLTARLWLWFRMKQGEPNEWEVTSSIDWSKTKAAMVGESLVYVNLPKTDPQYDAVREKLIQDIAGLLDPVDGTRIVKRVVKGEEFYKGPYVPEGPDLLVHPSPGYSFDISLPAKELWERVGPESDYSSFHTEDGIFFAAGPGIPSGLRLEEASLYDLAPTILSIYGLQHSGEFDGMNLFPSITAAQVAVQEVKTNPGSQENPFSQEDQEKVMERLKDLGYI